MKLIPQSAVVQMFNLSTDAVAQCMFDTGWKGIVFGVECLGMTPDGTFVYKCEVGGDGQKRPVYFKTFRMKASLHKDLHTGWKPEALKEEKIRADMSRTLKYYKHTTAKPGYPNWPDAVQRAAELLREDPEESLVHTCQHVPLKYLAQLKAEAEEYNKNNK